MSDLPNTENINVVTLSIAWDFAKSSTHMGNYDSEKDYLDALLKNFNKARNVVVDRKDLDEVEK